MYKNTSDISLEHYGVKGMRWGVRKDRFKVGKVKTYKLTSHKSNPRKYKPNSVLDHYSKTGILDARSFYNKDGKTLLEVVSLLHIFD